ncbi:protein-L-isoaspartate O-methyltransferase family protein [Pacificimonas sp. ICDLI1SI03]
MEPDFAKMRTHMIDSQLRPNTVVDPALIKAFRSVPRERYVPAAMRSFAYHDEDIEIADGRFLMEPLTLGRLLSAARVRAGERVLIIGGGTGYSAALLTEMGADVVLLEEEAFSGDIVKGDGISVSRGPLSEGVADSAPYDLVLIEGTVEQVPAALIEQVAEGGRIVGVVVEEGVARAGLGKVYGGHVGWSWFFDANVPALPGFSKKREFVF